jgi:hypothetical protein
LIGFVGLLSDFSCLKSLQNLFNKTEDIVMCTMPEDQKRLYVQISRSSLRTPAMEPAVIRSSLRVKKKQRLEKNNDASINSAV